jgi:hypothetical protein
MYTRRHHKVKNYRKSRKTIKSRGGKNNGRKWLTAIDAANQTLEKTGSIVSARQSLRRQALYNARKLFGSIGK